MDAPSVAQDLNEARLGGVKLSCRNVWKLFGADTERRFDAAQLADLGAAELAARGQMAAVRDVTLDVRAGEIFVLMGLSGSGKSTLLRCLSRLIEPSAGVVMFEDQNLLDASPAQMIEIRRHKMGMVFQHFALLPHLTVIDNVAFPLSLQKVGKAERQQRARDVLELVGLKGKELSFPRQLSGGQQQRVGIARSLAANPELWFLDEPFSALDPLIRREMQAELQRLQNVLKKTIVFVTHDFDEAIRLADRIAIMKDGAVVQLGTPEDLVLNPATDYVAEFTGDVDRAKVVSAGRIMRPWSGVAVAGEVNARDKIVDIAPRVIGAGQPFAVRVDGAVVGEIDPEMVLAILLARGSKP
ncbi:quaternary amine ABC transporter ATP-binding protein [Dongia rigui]|uniref:Quaternary amine transport ATP-binding protein n=1 Tax=Dongia rigui TaxID=940149 RepID=A0ABU5DSA8_9PROT|nr:betaine/proline/choline family ABC transporter ATP-binding protein [Dongia rigui]MDY0870311.1 betaine/proline/choline family ABC transporter ATP-binding protein [Dongia rigui]